MQGPTTAVLSLVFFICLLGFTSVSGPFPGWTTSTFSDLGTFLGGLFGPIALVLAVFQYAASERANRGANRIATEDRHRFDLRNSIERRVQKLDAMLDDHSWLMIRDKPFALRTVIGSAVAYLPDFQIPDFLQVQEQMRQNPTGSYPAAEILLLERCAWVAIEVNQLKLLCEEYDILAGNNIISEEVRSSYVSAIKVLKSKSYPVERWE